MKKLLLPLIAVLVIAAGGFWYWTTTPQYAVSQAAKAMKAHDLVDFRNWVDTESVASNAVDDLMTDPIRTSFGHGLLNRVAGFAVATFMKPTATESMQKQLESYVVTPPKTDNEDAAISEKEEEKDIVQELTSMFKPPSLRQIFREYGFTSKNYKGLGTVNQSGNISHVGLKFYSPRAKREIEVLLELFQGNNRWRVTKIANLQQICRDVSGI